MHVRDIKKALRYPSKITSLNLSSSKPKLTEIPKSIYAFGNLEKLDLSNNEIKVLPVSLFDAFPKLKSLNVSKNRGIRFNGFSSFKTHNIESLDLAGCRLTELPDFLLNCNWLRQIDLSSSYIKSLPREWILVRSLKSIACRNNAVLKKYLTRVEPFRNDFNRLSLTDHQRETIYAFFSEKSIDESQISHHDLLVGANLSKVESRHEALIILDKRFSEASSVETINKDSRLVFTGRIPFQKHLEKRLKDIGAVIEPFPSAHTTHIVVGEYPFFKGLFIEKNEPRLLSARNLFNSLTLKRFKGKEKNHFVEKIRLLLNSRISQNIELALNLLSAVRIPKELMTDLLELWFTTNNQDWKRHIKALLELNGQPGLPVLLASLSQIHSGKRKKISIKTLRKLGLDDRRVKALLDNQ
ncbi:MAG: leucine-rich repeat domain-containing protein [Bacteroidota bacterium]